MSIDILAECGCAYLALQDIRYKGNTLQGVNGTLQKGTNVTFRIGDFVKYDTATNDWERVLTSDELGATDRIAVITRLKNVSTGEEVGTVDVTSAQFKNAILWMNGGDTNIRCADCYLWDGSARVAFAPETHTSLAAKLVIHPYADADGGETYYFSFD